MNTIWHELRTWFVRRASGRGQIAPPALPGTISTLLDSSLPGAPFRARISIVHQHSVPDRAATAQLAQVYEELRRCAATITRRFSVLHLPEAQDEINLYLAGRGPISNGTVDGECSTIELRVDTQVTEHAIRYETIRNEETIAGERHRAHMEQNAVLREQILTDPAQARLWWLEGKRERLRELVQMGDTFETLARVLSVSSAPDTSAGSEWILLLEDFLSKLDPRQTDLLLSQLDRVFTSYERIDLSDRVHGLRSVSPQEDDTASERDAPWDVPAPFPPDPVDVPAPAPLPERDEGYERWTT